MTKTLPQSIQSEEALLGSIFIDPNKMKSVAPIVEEKDFYKKQYGTIFGAMLQLWQKNKPIDLITVSNLLKEIGALKEVGGTIALSELTLSVPCGAHAVEYANIIKEKSEQRDIISFSDSLKDSAFNETSSEEITKSINDFVLNNFKEKKENKTFKPYSESVMSFIDDIATIEEKDILKFGLEPLDRHDSLGGIFPSDVIVIAADTGIGKSTFALDVAHKNATAGKKVVLFDLENDEFTAVRRRIFNAIRKKDKYSKFTMRDLRVNTKLLSDDVFKKTFEEATDSEIKSIGENLLMYSADKLPTIEIFLQHFQRIKDCDLVVIDHLHYFEMEESRENYSQQIGKIIRAIRNVAKVHKVPILVVSHLRKRHNRKEDPNIDDLFGSSSIGKEATAVIFLKKLKEIKYNTKMIVEKAREEGGDKQYKLLFDTDLKQFTNWEVFDENENNFKV